MRSTRILYVEIVDPDGIAFQGEAAGVQAPGIEGSFEVLYNHAPMLTSFGVGAIRVRTAGGERVFYPTSGGFLKVGGNHVYVMADTVGVGYSQQENGPQFVTATRPRSSSIAKLIGQHRIV